MNTTLLLPANLLCQALYAIQPEYELYKEAKGILDQLNDRSIDDGELALRVQSHMGEITVPSDKLRQIRDHARVTADKYEDVGKAYESIRSYLRMIRSDINVAFVSQEGAASTYSLIQRFLDDTLPDE